MRHCFINIMIAACNGFTKVFLRFRGSMCRDFWKVFQNQALYMALMIIYARGLYDRVAPSTNYYCFNKLPLFYNSYFEAFVIKMIKKSRSTNSRILKFTISGFLVMNS